MQKGEFPPHSCEQEGKTAIDMASINGRIVDSKGFEVKSVCESALEIAANGLCVFPCTANKTPYTRRGFKDATQDTEAIKKWWAEYPQALIGVPTGRDAGFFVLDIDMPDGQESLKDLCDKHGDLSATKCAQTQNGGLHYYFKVPHGVEVRNSAGKIGINIDVRADGGYVISPPSMNGAYHWLNDCEIAEPPNWLIELVRKKVDAPRLDSFLASQPVLKSSQYGESALESEIAEVKRAPEGARNDTLNRAAFAVGQLVAGGELDESEALSQLKNAAEYIGLPTREIESTIQSGINSGKREPRSATTPGLTAKGKSCPKDEKQADQWAFAKQQFPRVPVPWECFPDSIAESLKQLARSCAVTPEPLLGTSLAILGSIVGRSASISPKESWKEPLITWFADVRGSGEGKTPPSRMLLESLYEWQRNEDEKYKNELQTYSCLPKKDREQKEPPAPARTYYTTDFTLEGLRSSLEGHSTGGLVVMLDELSAFFSGQNQFKGGKGADREAFLCLYDGKPARTVRVGRTVSINGARVQICGGIQPSVLKQSLTAKNGIFMQDGTAFRFMFTFMQSSYRDLTAEAWSKSNKENWQLLLSKAKQWADQRAGSPLAMTLNTAAQDLLLEWRNDITKKMKLLPESCRGFIPKAIGGALRLAGLLHCLKQFEQGENPNALLYPDTMENGIKLMQFYMGHTVDVMRYISGDDNGSSGSDVTDTRIATLLEVLPEAVADMDQGKVAVGHVAEMYNQSVPTNDGESPKSIGVLLRQLELNIMEKTSWRDKRNVNCLLYDDQFKKVVGV
jgi:hypothetical protein